MPMASAYSTVETVGLTIFNPAGVVSVLLSIFHTMIFYKVQMLRLVRSRAQAFGPPTRPAAVDATITVINRTAL
jgi:hypothetical protein